jgi:hypothetical protein
MEAPDAMDSDTRTGDALAEMDSWKQRAQLRSERLQAFNGRRPPRLRCSHVVELASLPLIVVRAVVVRAAVESPLFADAVDASPRVRTEAREWPCVSDNRSSQDRAWCQCFAVIPCATALVAVAVFAAAHARRHRRCIKRRRESRRYLVLFQEGSSSTRLLRHVFSKHIVYFLPIE